MNEATTTLTRAGMEVDGLAHVLPFRSDMSSAMTDAESSRCFHTSPSRESRRPRYSQAAATESVRKRVQGLR